MCGECIAEPVPTAVSSRDIRLWRNILHSKVVLVGRRFPKTFSDPEKTPCSVHVNILSYYEIRWYLYRDCPVMTRWRDYRDFSGAAVL